MRRRELALAAGLVAPLYLVRIWSPDLWWHLATGRFILEHRAIPRVDPFSFTVHGQPWRCADWLADLVLYGAHALGALGIEALVVLSVFATLFCVGLALRELGVERRPAMATVVLVGLLAQPRYSIARPLALAAPLLALAIYWVVRSEQRRDLALLWLPPLTALWAPIHPTVVLAPLLGGIALGARLLGKRGRRQIAIASAALAGALLVLVLSRAGRDQLATALALGQTPLAAALTLEWQRSTLFDPRLFIPLLLFVAALAAARPRRDLVPILLALAGGALASRYLRNLYEGLLLAAPLVGLLVERLDRLFAARRLAIARAALPLVVALGLPALNVALAGEPAFDADLGVGYDLSLFPEKSTLDTLARLPPAPIIHDCTLGGYLMWRRLPVYCDGRTVALYDERAIHELFLPLYRGLPSIDAVAARYRAGYALARTGSDFERALMGASDWLPLRYDRHTSLFARLESADGSLGDLRFVNDPAWMERWYAPVLASAERRARLASAVVRAFAESPESPTLLGAVTWLKAHDPALAAEIRARLP